MKFRTLKLALLITPQLAPWCSLLLVVKCLDKFDTEAYPFGGFQ